MTWKTTVIVLSLGLATLLAACGAESPPATSAQQAAQAKADHNQIYVPKNNAELDNYNKRQQITDDPSTILWCTSAFPVPSSPLFTIPVLDKLTSSTKRPFSTSTVHFAYQDSGNYSPELPGPDGMYGPSDSYRYGFTPGGVYVEFSGAMETYCTTEPMVWQRQSTTIVLSPDAKLLAAQRQCQGLVAGKAADATTQCQALLLAAIK